MSRRHYIAAGGEVIPEGCVFLAPLGEGDLKDHVSGESFVVDGQLTWNANEKAYLVTLGCAGHNNFRNCKFRVRDLMFFTAALDLSTIKQIQGL